MPVEKITWVPLQTTDVEIVDRIAQHIHPSLPERQEVFLEKISLFPEGCFKLLFEGTVAGYGISHPWKLFSIPPLDDLLKGIPEDADCIYMHDVAVLEKARGRGAAGLYVDEIRKVARRMQIPHLACVSVYGTDTLWSWYGFQVHSSPELSAKLASYGSSAKYMVAEA